MDLDFRAVQQLDVGDIARRRVSIHDVFVVYQQHFGRWFAITTPTSLTASLVLYLADEHVRTIFRNSSRIWVGPHIADLALAGALRFGSFFLAWLLGCFALGAISSAFIEPSRDDENVWYHDSHQRAREHLGALLVVALLTFCAFAAGGLAFGFIELMFFRVAHWSHFSELNYPIVLAGVTVIASIVSWFGMAIPLILREDIGAWSAMKRSVKLSDGYEVFLFLLVIESVVGSCVGWYATHYGLVLLFPASVRQESWYGWLIYFVSILASAAVQPPMFLGFSLLAYSDHNSVLPPRS